MNGEFLITVNYHMVFCVYHQTTKRHFKHHPSGSKLDDCKPLPLIFSPTIMPVKQWLGLTTHFSILVICITRGYMDDYSNGTYVKQWDRCM